MTDEQIVQAWEKILSIGDAPIGKYWSVGGIVTTQLAKETIDMLNRQKAEIERLKKDKYILKDGNLELLPRTDIDIIKSEAIRVFVEELILDVQRHLMPNVDDGGMVTVENAERYFISRIKEMVGETND